MAVYGIHPVSNAPAMPLTSNMSADDSISRPLCPQCLHGHGDPRVVMLQGPSRKVTYVCDRCLHEWDVPDKPKSDKP
jgi:hypothetical protein